NGSATFQRLVEAVMADELWHFVLAYLDDIIIFSATFEEHVEHLQRAFDKLANANLKANPGKCDLAETEIAFLGHIVTHDGVRPNEENTKKVKEFPRPKNAKQMKSFLGLCSYYRRFVPKFADLSAPLFHLTKLGVKYEWTHECEKAFQHLKDILTSDPVVAMPDFTKRFYLQTDASNTGIGWTLSQKHDGMDRAVHYGGRALKPAEKNYPVIEKESLAIVAAVKNLHNYLANDQFTILTDHQPLEYMLKTRDRFNKMIRWVLYLQAYDFVIEYRPGKANGNADALSRIPWEQLQAEAAKDPIQEKKSTKNRKKTEQPESKIEKEEVFFTPNTTVEGEDESNVMKYESEAFKERSKLELDERNLNNSSPCIIDEQKGEKQKFSAITENPFDKESIIRHQKADPQLLGKMEYLADKVLPEDSKEKKEILRDIDNYLIDNGVLYHVFSPRIATTEGTWKQLVIPKKYRAQILQLNHDEPASAHFGFAKTADKIRRRYYWPNMLTDIQTWVNTCIICQQDKGTTKKNAPLYPIATGEVFEALHCDVVGPFPRTDAGNRYVVVFIERLTAWPEAFAVASTEANVIAELLLHHIIFRFGVPRHFVTDQGKNFLSNLMAEVCNMLNIKQIKTTPYHPQSNGIVERLNGTLVKGISHFVASRQNDWDQYLPSVLFAYRTSVNESRKESPYYLMFGREATLPSDLQFNRVRSYHLKWRIIELE
uniref:Uncharacterized protein n=1 Tax=Clytia hemisphaerica TaxID=252671 RepID=A0A7M5WLR4_9CNID